MPQPRAGAHVHPPRARRRRSTELLDIRDAGKHRLVLILHAHVPPTGANAVRTAKSSPSATARSPRWSSTRPSRTPSPLRGLLPERAYGCFCGRLSMLTGGRRTAIRRPDGRRAAASRQDQQRGRAHHAQYWVGRGGARRRGSCGNVERRSRLRGALCSLRVPRQQIDRRHRPVSPTLTTESARAVWRAVRDTL